MRVSPPEAVAYLLELSSASGLASSLSIDSIACTLRLADVYERMAFPPEVLEAYPEEPSSA